jgi:GTP pyrophosphokinase
MLLSVDSVDLKRASEQLWSWLEHDLNHLTKDEKELVNLAFMQMVESHGEQRRKSGDFYIIHPVAATKTLAKLNLDAATLAACLVHDVPEDTETTLATIQKNFGGEIAFLVNGITKLGKVKYRGNQRYAENLRKMFIAMSEDLRVIFIKLADRIHNLETLEHLPPDKAQRIALESVDIYSRIAERLGMVAFQSRIEDLCFPILYPEKYSEFISSTETELIRRKRQLEQLKNKIRAILDTNGFEKVELKGRVKRYYSIYNKMELKGYAIDNIFDLSAVRIITHNEEDCYQILSLLHKHFHGLEKRMKDYIHKPKQNGYQSIHSSLKDSDQDIFFEVQIRTQEMHEFAEYGVAAHWAYKDRSKHAHNTLQTKWIQELVELGSEPLSDEEYLKRVRLDLYQDRIFVMTPKNDPINLPEGSTAIDFAFRVHEDLGMHASMAKVNGLPQKLTLPLKSGDIVEIIADKKQEPKQDWLNYVVTVNAARKIRNRLRKLGYKI